MNKHIFLKAVKTEKKPNEALELWYGFESGVGYYLQAIPMKVRQMSDGTVVKNFKGEDVMEVIVISGKNYSEKKWESFVEDLETTWDISFLDNPMVISFLGGE